MIIELQVIANCVQRIKCSLWLWETNKQEKIYDGINTQLCINMCVCMFAYGERKSRNTICLSPQSREKDGLWIEVSRKAS